MRCGTTRSGDYPALSLLIDRFDGKPAEALYLQVNEQPLGTANAWNTVTVDPATSLFKNNNKNNGNEADAGATYTLNKWIALYGDRSVNRIRWGGTGNAGCPDLYRFYRDQRRDLRL